MKILFIHQNFPAQFKHLAPALVRQGHCVDILTLARNKMAAGSEINTHTYVVERGSTPAIHPWISDMETKVIRAEAAFRAALKLREGGYVPDLVIAHPGWGEAMFIKEVWPFTKLAIYCEFFYKSVGADVGFDPEFSKGDEDIACRLRLKNLNSFAHFDIADAAISPTHWQAGTYPEEFRRKISVIHDGIDTRELTRSRSPTIYFTDLNGNKVTLTRDSEIISFVNRNLEPYRGYHIFMRCLPTLLAARPNMRVIIIGGDNVSYGGRPNPAIFGNRSWKQIFIDEVRPLISDTQWARIHFLGNLSYEQYKAILSLSSVHVYLTYPFVLSWSLLEAMSLGCSVVASDTGPLKEVINDNENGLLVSFFDIDRIIDAVLRLLADRALSKNIANAARKTIVEHYDLRDVCLPKQLGWVNTLLYDAR